MRVVVPDEPRPPGRLVREKHRRDLVPRIVYRGRGCRNCLGTGFRGRRGVFEMMPMTEEIRVLIMQHASAGAIRKIAVDQGMHSLREDGWRLVNEGVTTIEEIVFATKDENDLMRKAEGPAPGHVNGAAAAAVPVAV